MTEYAKPENTKWAWIERIFALAGLVLMIGCFALLMRALPLIFDF